jgi:hypothetical protein
MTRRTKITSPDGQKALHERLLTKIESPVKLNAEEQVEFDGIIKSLPTDAWEPFRLRHAANLAKLQVQTHALLDEVANTDSDLMPDAYKLKHNALAKNLSTINSMMRVLGISASQRGISDDSQRAKRQAEKEAKAALSKIAGSDLIA